MARDNRNSNRKNSQITVSEIDGDYLYLHNATNISDGGIYIESSTPFRTLKDEVTISVLTPKKTEIRFKGRVTHTEKKRDKEVGFGLEFGDFEKGSIKELIELAP